MILSDTSATATSTPSGWDSLAGSLGCSQKVSQGVRLGGAHYLTEYLPRDQSMGMHTRRFTVTVYPLPENPLDAGHHAEAILESAIAGARQAGAVFRECVTIPTSGGSAAFFDYSSADQHTVMAAVSTTRNTLTIYQLTVSNGAIPSLADVLLFRSLTAAK